MGNNIIEIKCCQECEIHGLNRYKNESKFTNKNILIKNVLKEDCEVHKWYYVKAEGNKEPLVLDEEKFVDSWMLSYKVKGMREPVRQYHLTEEECHIILGNMNDLTYIHMEVMR